MRIKIGEIPEQTKTYKYMFGIELTLYNLTNIEKAFERLEPFYLNEPWDRINVYLDDVATKDYNLEDQLNSETPLYMYHIKVDTRATDFEQIIHTLKSSPNYIDCYQCGSVDCNYAIIRFKVSITRRMELLLNSKYSQLYKPDEIKNIKKNQYIVMRYGKQLPNGDKVFTEPFQVLTKDEEAFKILAEKYNITDDKTLSIMKNNEFDSKINLSNEIIDSRTLC